MKRVAVATLGCKVNTFESELILQRLDKQGYARVPASESADIYIINSCTVTAEADRQSRQLARKLKRQNMAATVIMTGCFAQNNAETISQIPEVDWVVGNAAKLDLPQLLASHAQQALPEKLNLHPEFDELLALPQDLLSGYESQSRAFIQIQQGCDQACTFCIVHVARGPSVSFPQQTVLTQFQEIVEQGYKEVVVCGVDLGAYGDDLSGHQSLVTLLRAMLALDLDCRIRISSIDPYHLTPDLIDLIGSHEQLCPHIHLSMQSANSMILKRMKRRADRDMIFKRVAELRAIQPTLVLSADVLVGFPTESEAQFSETLDAIALLEIAYPHVFPYSSRAGTPAAKIPKQVETKVKKQRAKLIREMGQKVWRKQALQRLSTVQRTVVESSGKSGMIARCNDYFPVKLINGVNGAQKGQWCDVQITGIQGQTLLGKIALSA